MVIISYKAIRNFATIHPYSEEALNNWYLITERCDWKNFNELRQIFGSADAVGNDLYVFNIRGGNYRLIARILFSVRTVYIKFVGTHKEYDRIDLDDL